MMAALPQRETESDGRDEDGNIAGLLLESLPIDIWKSNVAEFLHFRDVMSLACVSPYFRGEVMPVKIGFLAVSGAEDLDPDAARRLLHADAVKTVCIEKCLIKRAPRDASGHALPEKKRGRKIDFEYNIESSRQTRGLICPFIRVLPNLETLTAFRSDFGSRMADICHTETEKETHREFVSTLVDGFATEGFSCDVKNIHRILRFFCPPREENEVCELCRKACLQLPFEVVVSSDWESCCLNEYARILVLTLSDRPGAKSYLKSSRYWVRNVLNLYPEIPEKGSSASDYLNAKRAYTLYDNSKKEADWLRSIDLAPSDCQQVVEDIIPPKYIGKIYVVRDTFNFLRNMGVDLSGRVEPVRVTEEDYIGITGTYKRSVWVKE